MRSHPARADSRQDDSRQRIATIFRATYGNLEGQQSDPLRSYRICRLSGNPLSIALGEPRPSRHEIDKGTPTGTFGTEIRRTPKATMMFAESRAHVARRERRIHADFHPAVLSLAQGQLANFSTVRNVTTFWWQTTAQSNSFLIVLAMTPPSRRQQPALCQPSAERRTLLRDVSDIGRLTNTREHRHGLRPRTPVWDRYPFSLRVAARRRPLDLALSRREPEMTPREEAR